LKLAIGKKTFTPRFQTKRCSFELVINLVDRLSVRRRRRASTLDCFLEARHFGPERLKAEEGRLSRSALVGEEEWAMIREGRRQGVKHMILEL
jgi:hypothetical protein